MPILQSSEGGKHPSWSTAALYVFGRRRNQISRRTPLHDSRKAAGESEPRGHGGPLVDRFSEMVGVSRALGMDFDSPP